MAIQKIDLDALRDYSKFVALDNSGKQVRCAKEPGGNIFVFAPRKKRRGHRYSQESFLELGYSMKKCDEAADWSKSITKARKILEKSGLWEEMLVVYKNLETMTYADYKAIKSIDDDLFWTDTKDLSPDERKAHYGEYGVKYPFIFNDNGTLDHTYFWELSQPRFKSMYFGALNDSYKADIKRALDNKESFSTGKVRTSYDTSFRYDAKENKAWYSEEYKDCGNGHYYLAIDATTALFCEND